MREEARELRSQLEQERAYKKEVEDECWDKEESLNQTRSELAAALAEVAVLKQKSVTASVDLPEAADLLNKLKAKRKKSPVTLADIEAILEMIEEF